MPLYEHRCESCQKITEHVCRIAERQEHVECRHCGGSAKRIISAKIARDEPVWLASAVSNLHDEAAPQISNRTEFNRYLKDNNIVQRA